MVISRAQALDTVEHFVASTAREPLVNSMPTKRPRHDDPDARALKHAKLEDDTTARPTAGANLIEVNGKTCTHEVAWPPGQEGIHLPPAQSAAAPAKEYAFPLDPFQQTAINSLEAGNLSALCATFPGVFYDPSCTA